jgi:hypothetical protein
VRLYASAKPLADAIMERMSKDKMKRHQKELQRRILELIQDFDLKTDWRVKVLLMIPPLQRSESTVKQPRIRALPSG